jgi:hypothetical protein
MQLGRHNNDAAKLDPWTESALEWSVTILATCVLLEGT